MADSKIEKIEAFRRRLEKDSMPTHFRYMTLVAMLFVIVLNAGYTGEWHRVLVIFATGVTFGVHLVRILDEKQVGGR